MADLCTYCPTLVFLQVPHRHKPLQVMDMHVTLPFFMQLSSVLLHHPLLLCCSCRRHASVKLLCELGLYEDAVPLALAVDLELAKAVANSPEDDDQLRRKLWLSIAKHVVQVCRQCM